MPVAPPERPPLVAGAAILIGAAMVALSIAFTFRFDVAPLAPRAAALRLDRWTGEIRWCEPASEEAAIVLKCTAK